MEPVQHSSRSPRPLPRQPQRGVPPGTVAWRPNAVDRDNMVQQPHVAGMVLGTLVGLRDSSDSWAGAGAHSTTRGRGMTIAAGSAARLLFFSGDRHESALKERYGRANGEPGVLSS